MSEYDCHLPRQFARSELSDGFIVNIDLACKGSLQASYSSEQRGFSASVASRQCHHFTRFEVLRYVLAQRHTSFIANGEVLKC